MAGFEPRVVPVGPGDRGLLDQLERLYASAFPASERKPASFLRTAAGREDYSLLALISGDRADGLALVYRSPGSAFALLEYMAVAPGRRGEGLGRRLFTAVAGRNPGRALLVEVESANDRDPDSRRRIAFYRDLGCRELRGVDYVMPKVSSAAPPPMSLLACGCAAVTADSLRAWLEEIMDRVYSAPDPAGLVEPMLAASPATFALS
jgi:GNAT superfamily N-acetyltransferase